ncbi:peptidase [Streptococcus pseudoporcinus]|uniref:Peptidase n=1 Tax=Streptococcus pseudoporcinus TaxID=361101 RepID=A0A4U9ZE10_9STRE|nr:M20/M25/M40 family metallo-hydrolase [Streptococcus pseudoporcinus]VTS37949.1 peptidase [Streptococcus pseudoporcinus]
MHNKDITSFDKDLWHDTTIQTHLEELRQLIAIKSIYAQNIGLRDAATYLGKIFEKAGAHVTIDQSYKAPFVIAEFKSPFPEAKTLIFYNHYDTVPTDSDQKWTADPFTLDIRDDMMYGRGVDDDKGHILARLTAVSRYLRERSALPLNITFIIEGAEESASVDLENYLAKHKDKLADADLLIWEQGIRNQSNQLELTGGNKGILTFDMSVTSAVRDIHSKFGGVVDSATWYLLEAISSLRDKEGTLLVDGISEHILPVTQRELDLVVHYSTENGNTLQKLYGLSLPLLQSEQEAFLMRYYFQPSVTIQGISSGYLGRGVKTIIPAYASAKMEVRLVPGLDPHDVFEMIKKQLQRLGFPNVDLTYTLGEKSYRSDLTNPEILRLIRTVESNYTHGVCLLPTSAGTGPMHTVFEVLEVPMISLGLGNANSSDHSGDENVLISDYLRHIILIEEFIKSYE